MMVSESAPGQVLIHDRARRQWTSFQEPLEVIEAHRCEEVLSCLHHVESVVQDQGCYAAGFLSYEAGPAFDPAIHAHPPDAFPLLWFGLYERPERLSLPAGPRGRGSGYTLGAWTPGVDAGAYRRCIARVREHIARGDTYQVNYTLRLHASFSGNALEFFLDTSARQEEGYFAFLDLGRFAVCSFSPELFFRLDGQEVISRPMKGTTRRGTEVLGDREAAESLLSSEKDRAENVMIVDLLRNDLSRVCRPGTVRVPELFALEQHPTVHHLVSTVVGELDPGRDAVELLRATFPGGSITGAPKLRAMEIIAELEPTRRGVYCGSLGYLAATGEMDTSIAIRTAVVRDGEVYFQAGGGIVADSDPEAEYRETLDKARGIIRALALP
jgi:para-aminobenzoate synthetase/4-amino-4-deoxychorismate lyase